MFATWRIPLRFAALLVALLVFLSLAGAASNDILCCP